MTIIPNPKFPFEDIEEKDFSELEVGDIFFISFPNLLYMKTSVNEINNSVCLCNGKRFTVTHSCHLIKNPIIFQAGE